MSVVYKSLSNETIRVIIPVMEHSKSTFSAHFEILLPVVFILLFILVLFLIYAYNNLDLKGILMQVFCCIGKSPAIKPNRIYAPVNRTVNNYAPSSQIQMSQNANRSSNYAFGAISEFRRYRETHSNFYMSNDYQHHQQHQFLFRPKTNFIPMGYAPGDYENIYAPNQASKMIVSFRPNNVRVNQLYRSDSEEDTLEYQLPETYINPINNNQHDRRVENLTKNEIIDRIKFASGGDSSGYGGRKQNLSKQFSSVVFNLSEPSQSELSESSCNSCSRRKQLRITKSLLKQRASTFRALNEVVTTSSDGFGQKESKRSKLTNKLKDLSSESSILKSIYKELKLVHHQAHDSSSSFCFSKKPGTKYARLCKSFTFQGNQNRPDLDQQMNNLSAVENGQPDGSGSDRSDHFASEPAKLASSAVWSSVSFKPLTQRANYLKRLNMIKSSSFTASSNKDDLFLLFKKSKNSKVFHDAAVQTSIILSENSSSNSQITNSLITQTNTFGSILANFGSASLKQQAQSSASQSGKLRLKAYSYENGLSDLSATSNLGTYSVSSSRLVYPKVQV